MNKIYFKDLASINFSVCKFFEYLCKKKKKKERKKTINAIHAGICTEFVALSLIINVDFCYKSYTFKTARERLDRLPKS